MGVLELNSTTDPNTQYGGCAPGSGFRKKADVLLEARPNIRNINSIVVTECHAADGAPGTVRVPCPKGSFYAACFKNSDDGVGNHVEFGVVNSFGSSDPVGQYGGYSPGHSIYRNKSALVTDVGKSLDKVVGITVVFGSDNFGGGTRIVPCGILSFTYCIESDGDPTGGGVFVGVTERP